MTDDLRTVEHEPWVADAACRSVDPNLFFPSRGEDAKYPKAICAACSVRAECLDYAMTHFERHGIWGGLSAKERRLLRIRRRGPIVRGVA